MRILAVFDENNYQDTESLYEKYSVRGIIMRDGKLAMQCGSDGEYKIPGGGKEEGETFIEALAREIREETGLFIIEEEVQALGEILEIRRDIFDSAQKYICHSLFYFCKVTKEQTQISLTPSELARGYHLAWASPEEIYRRNIQTEKDSWIIRDTAFIKMLIDKKIELP